MLVFDQYRAWYDNTASLVRHIISGPVRVISGIIFASGSLLRSYRGPDCGLRQEVPAPQTAGCGTKLLSVDFVSQLSSVFYGQVIKNLTPDFLFSEIKQKI